MAGLEMVCAGERIRPAGALAAVAVLCWLLDDGHGTVEQQRDGRLLRATVATPADGARVSRAKGKMRHQLDSSACFSWR